MPEEYAVIDLFAGPGGLAEGFSAVRRDTRQPFKVVLSVEKERSAWETLRLRTFLRQFDELPGDYLPLLHGSLQQPDWEALYPGAWEQASREAVLLELGAPGADEFLEPRLDQIRKVHSDHSIVIGGPPCQAYSVVGRARNKGIQGYIASEDHRHFLYQQYIRILTRLRPVAFVMENVRGMLSSTVDGFRVFDKVAQDLENPAEDLSYQLVQLGCRSTLFPTERPVFDDFLVHADEFGVPQARQRIIVVGIRSDIQRNARAPQSWLQSQKQPRANVRDAIRLMPVLRSGLSQESDSTDAWRGAVVEAIELLKTVSLPSEDTSMFARQLGDVRRRLDAINFESGEVEKRIPASAEQTELQKWIEGRAQGALPNNMARGHMRSDLQRYLFSAVFAEAFGRSPKARDFPAVLAPAHRNWTSGAFDDRFRVQLWDRPSTTITSHIAKDGHAFIHPDPVQCRSLTVREAARLQTFPDDYLFLGNRTQQFTQVGNAVPPFLARQIGEALLALLEPKEPSEGTD